MDRCQSRARPLVHLLRQVILGEEHAPGRSSACRLPSPLCPRLSIPCSVHGTIPLAETRIALPSAASTAEQRRAGKGWREGELVGTGGREEGGRLGWMVVGSRGRSQEEKEGRGWVRWSVVAWGGGETVGVVVVTVVVSVWGRGDRFLVFVFVRVFLCCFCVVMQACRQDVRTGLFHARRWACHTHMFVVLQEMGMWERRWLGVDGCRWRLCVCLLVADGLCVDVVLVASWLRVDRVGAERTLNHHQPCTLLVASIACQVALARHAEEHQRSLVRGLNC